MPFQGVILGLMSKSTWSPVKRMPSDSSQKQSWPGV